jgi:hypothetical protein
MGNRTTKNYATKDDIKGIVKSISDNHGEVMRSIKTEVAPRLPGLESNISDQAIDNFVHTLLTDPAMNIPLVPNSMESALYGRILKALLHTIAHVSDGAGIDFIGHKIRVVIEPVASMASASPTDKLTSSSSDK